MKHALIAFWKWFRISFCVAIIGVLLVFAICFVWLIRDYYFYEPTKTVVIRDYYRAVGLSPRIENDDMSLTKKLYGEPVRVEEEPFYSTKLVYLYYDGFAILFRDDGQSTVYYGFELYSSDRKIRRDIHVGSTRDEIIAAYSKCESIDYWERNGVQKGDEVWDCINVNYFAHHLKFTYDENNVVTCIRYTP